MGQKSRQRETECRVSILFSSPSWKTCLSELEWELELGVLNGKQTKTNVLGKQKHADLPRGKEIYNQQVNPCRSQCHLTGEHLCYTWKLHKSRRAGKKLFDKNFYLLSKIERIVEPVYTSSSTHTSGNKYLLAKISRSVSGVHERYSKYAYRSPSATYGIILSIDFFVCNSHGKEQQGFPKISRKTL